eukprot:1144026-Rhodomonas_salina.1
MCVPVHRAVGVDPKCAYVCLFTEKSSATCVCMCLLTEQSEWTLSVCVCLSVCVDRAVRVDPNCVCLITEQSEWIRGVVVSTLARVQHLPVASTPLFLQ